MPAQVVPLYDEVVAFNAKGEARAANGAVRKTLVRIDLPSLVRNYKGEGAVIVPTTTGTRPERDGPRGGIRF